METQFKKQILFVQDPDNQATVWDSLIALMVKDQHIRERYDWHIYREEAEMEDLVQATRRFAEWYKTQKMHWTNSDIILVGHGLGGMLILSFLIEHLKDGHSKEFYNLRQLILFATPHLGYAEISIKARIMNFLKYKTTIQTIKAWDTQILEINEMVREHIINSTEFNNYYRPMSIQAYGGIDDQLVTSSSAKGYHPNFTVLPGDHLSVIQPTDYQDVRYKAFKVCLDAPPPHKGIFSIEHLNVFIQVKPFSAGAIEVMHLAQKRLVVTDNFGIINRKIKFAKDNICFRPYVLRYGIENEAGYIDALPSGGSNIASSEKMDMYKARGLEYFFEFIPENEQEFGLEIHLYKGFDPQSRDAHFHLGNGKARYKKINIILNLHEYIDQLYQINPAPVLMLHAEDSHSCTMRFEERQESHKIPLLSSNEGTWQWEINDIGGGVIDLFWDIKK